MLNSHAHAYFRMTNFSARVMGSPGWHSRTAGEARTASMPRASQGGVSWVPPMTPPESPLTSPTSGPRLSPGISLLRIMLET